MLDPWIIEEILKRERDRKHGEIGQIELPLQSPPPMQIEHKPASEEQDRGVIIMDI